MITPERQAQARAVLPTEDAKKAFDALCAMYPEATLFWDHEGAMVDLELEGTIIRIQ